MPRATGVFAACRAPAGSCVNDLTLAMASGLRASMDIFGVPLPAMLSQLLLGLVNGSFYAILSLGLAVIFGLLNVINFAHGALFMLGAMLAWMGLSYFGLPYWVMLVLAPLIVGVFGMAIERSMMRWLYKLDHLY